MKLILIILGFSLLFGLLLWYILAMKKYYKQEQDDFKNANHVLDKKVDEE